MKWGVVVVILLLGLGGKSKKPNEDRPAQNHPTAIGSLVLSPVDTLARDSITAGGPVVAAMPIAISPPDTVTRLWQDDSKRVWVRLKGDAWLWGSPAMDVKDAVKLQAESVVEIVGYDSGFFKAHSEGRDGLLTQFHVPRNPTSNAIIERGKALEKERAQAEVAAKKHALIKRFGKKNADRIEAHKIWIGMSAEMTRESWGEPEDINRTVTGYSVSEQWVYEGEVYLYFEDGILNTWQE